MTAREVELTGGAPWGFRMHGGADQNQPLRISRVNPGRKASLSGIREGDLISSINGRATRNMTNADAHTMLRCAGPVLRLGLNEDREMSPRRRSIGKGTDLKRPSQLIAEAQKATPQAPVYATIRPSRSPQNKTSSSNMRSSLNSLPSALNSTPLVKSVVTSEEPLRFHPTNPFYTTLPSNYSSASKLPVPNSKSASTLDRNKKESPLCDYTSELKSPAFFTNTNEGSSSQSYCRNSENVNGYESEKSTANVTDPFTFHSYKKENPDFPNSINSKNPFEPKRNSDPFEKYLRQETIVNGKHDTLLPVSQSDNNFHKSEEIVKHSITEHKISEVEEVKTIKKIVLNGSGDREEFQKELYSPKKVFDDFKFKAREPDLKGYGDDRTFSSRERIIPVTPVKQNVSCLDKQDPSSKNSDSTYQRYQAYQPSRELDKPTAEAPEPEVVASKPPVRSPLVSACAQSPTPKTPPLVL